MTRVTSLTRYDANAQAVLCGHFREFVEHLSGVDGDVALRVRFDIVVAQIEQSLQIAFLHVHAEEVGVAFAEFETWFGFDAA